MNKNIKIGILATCVVLAIVAVLFLSNLANSNDPSSTSPKGNGIEMSGKPKEDKEIVEIDSTKQQELNSMTLEYVGTLEDVTEGETTRGLNTNNKAGGTAQFQFVDGEFSLKATFNNLPEPINDDFYEGWLVRRSTGDFITTGKANLENGIFTNFYTSTTDYTDYDYYVLTIEPNDGDPALDLHIVEGMLTK